jgi:glycosyltransferase involved in cell wall biosynthesis
MMRLLVITDEQPWPARSGYRLRLDRVVRTLARHDEVDLLVVPVAVGARLERPAGLPRLGRIAVVPAGPRGGSRAGRVIRWAVSRQPRAVGWRDWSRAHAVLEDWGAAPYDAAWFSHANTYLALGDAVDAPCVVDLDNLASSLLAHRGRVLREERVPSLSGRALVTVRWAVEVVDSRRWHRMERQIADRAAAVVVCSEFDRERLAHPQARVVENGYEAPPSLGRVPRPAGDAPVLLMVGLMTYEPNRDGAHFFALEVLPKVRAAVPNTTLRVVGRYVDAADVAGLLALSGVTVTGEVADLSTELDTADVAVVPVRFGGGTRIKILEALASRLPVVTTTVGVEGIDAIDGKHLLVADDAEAFADACIRLIQDPGLGATLADAGHELWRARYRWSVIAPAINAVVREVAGR